MILGRNVTGCPECSKEADNDRQDEERKSNKERDIKAALQSAGITKRFFEATFANYEAKNKTQIYALNQASQYADNFAVDAQRGRCMAFVGNPGTGKTHLAASIAREVISQGFTARMTTVGDYVREIKDFCWGRDKSRTETEVVSEYRKYDLLVLDEVGVQFGTTTEENLIFTLINKRYEDMKPTLVISNEDEAGLQKYLGERTFDRITEGGGSIIPFTWESYRGNK